MSHVTERLREPLTRDRILQAAISFADDEGLKNLSMRKLARALGYEVMSLYNHVANKEEMVGAMLEVVTTEMPLPTPGEDWKAQLRTTMVGGLRVFQKHPWAVPIWNTRMPGPARMALLEANMATLFSAGLSTSRADNGFHALGTHLQGFALQEQAFTPPLGQDLETAMVAFKKGLDPEEFPAMHTHIEWHEQNPEEAQEFEFVLNLILDGLDR